jgi:flavin reductase (DIM6/NTAB) family NADH-FMN oxidoreductase RutF
VNVATHEVDPTLMRRAMGQFATGVTVVTAVTTDGTPVGCTVNAFSSLSLDPPLVLVCIGTDRRMHEVLSSAPGYVVNVLAEHQQRQALQFARSGEDRFGDVDVTPGRHGIPLLTGAIAHVQCDRYDLVPGGDHTIVVGAVRELQVHDGQPLLYAQGAFLHLPRDDWHTALETAPQEWLLSAPW